jgi:hypothetical protein
MIRRVGLWVAQKTEFMNAQKRDCNARKSGIVDVWLLVVMSPRRGRLLP